MATIIPAVIPRTYEDLKATLAVLRRFTRSVQVDVVDGSFVPFISWPYNENDTIESLKEASRDMDIEVDLMIQSPEEVLSKYVEAGVKRVVVHPESTGDIARIFEHHRTHSYQLGIALGSDTSSEILVDHITQIDYVQLMGIEKIGSQGQPFDPRVLERIKMVRKSYPGLPISIDGGVNMETMSLLSQSGADRFVSGSAILKSENPETAFRSLLKAAEVNL